MAPPTWTQVHDAIQAAVAQASGLPASQVIWKYQNFDAPALDYVAMAFSSLGVVGIDALVPSYDGTRPAGQEIALTVTGVRELPLNVECFSASTADSSDALSRAEIIRTSMVLPSIRDQLAAVGVSAFDPQPVQYVPDVVAVGFRGRATMTVRCYVPAPLAQDLVGYIKTVNGTATISGEASPVVQPFSVVLP